MDTWQVRNIIGWDLDTWKRIDYYKKGELVSSVTPSLFGQMIVAGIQKRFSPANIADRLASLDNSLVLSKFQARTTPLVFKYSAYHLDNFGDMLLTVGKQFKGVGRDVSNLAHVSDITINLLVNFVHGMNKKGVHVYFANSPYIAAGVNKDEIRKDEAIFQKEFAPIGRFID